MTTTMSETFLMIINILLRWRKFILVVVAVSTILSGVVAFVAPKWYKSTASVFPAEQTDMLGGLDGVSNLVKSFSSTKKLGTLGGPSEVDRYVAILKSNTVLLAVIHKFDLFQVYDYADSPYRIEKTTKELISNTELEVQDEGNLTISVYDRDPQRAADIANYYVELLNGTNSELKVQNARGTRAFIEQRYNKNLQDLRKAEEAMKAFQLKHGVISVPDQTVASLKAGAEVAAELARKEIELGVLKRTLGEAHPNVGALQIETDEIKRKIHEMNIGPSADSGQMNILVPFKETPELGVQYVRLFREVEIQYKILQFVTPLFEQAKVEEQRNTPSVVVLDRAAPPERKAKPKIALWMLLSAVVSTVICLIIVSSSTIATNIRVAHPEQFEAIKHSLQSNVFGFKSSAPRK